MTLTLGREKMTAFLVRFSVFEKGSENALPKTIRGLAGYILRTTDAR